ncbi:hypothetical protein IWX62_003234 [Arthrobacter sp. CAN_A1]
MNLPPEFVAPTLTGVENPRAVVLVIPVTTRNHNRVRTVVVVTGDASLIMTMQARPPDVFPVDKRLADGHTSYLSEHTRGRH